MKHVKLFEQFVTEVLNETLNERFKGKDLKEPALGYIYNKDQSQVQVVNMVDKAIMMSYPSLKDAIDKKFNGQIGVDLVSRFKDRFDVEEVEVGGIYDVKESVVTESVKKGQIYTKASSDDQRLNARRGLVTAKEGDSVKLTKQKDSKTFNAVLTYNSGSWKGDTEQILIDIKELEGWELRESVVFESKEEDEAHDILQDLLNEWDPMDLEMMDMDQAMDTVDSYGHKGSKAKKIAQYLVKMAQSGQFESVVTEASVNVDPKLAQITLDYFASTGKKFDEEIYISRFDQDEIKKEYGGRLPRGFAGPDRSMLIGSILEPLKGDSWYMDDVDLVQGDETMMKIKPGKTTWADVKQKLKL